MPRKIISPKAAMAGMVIGAILAYAVIVCASLGMTLGMIWLIVKVVRHALSR